MRLLPRFLLFLVLFLAAAGLILPGYTGVKYPRQPGPVLDEQLRTVYRDRQELAQASIILLGDSVLKDSVNAKTFAQLTGRKTLLLAIPGSSSAQWYLVLKNNLAQARPKPDLLVIVFRDTILTTPDFRVSGKYFAQIDELATPQDRDLVERAFVGPMNPVERLAVRYLPLYGERLRLRDKLDDFLKYKLPGIVEGCDVTCVNAALDDAFAGEKMDIAATGLAVEEAEGYLYSLRNLDFNARLGESFLPLIVQLARENGIRLLLVRAQTAYPIGSGRQPLLMKPYIADLQQYLKTEGVDYLSFFGDPRLPPRYFTDPVHMSTHGKKVFTPMLAGAVSNLLASGR